MHKPGAGVRACFLPRRRAHAHITAFHQEVTPPGHTLEWREDVYGVLHARLTFPEPTDRLEVTISLTADLTPVNPFDFVFLDGAEQVDFGYAPHQLAALTPYLAPAGGGPRFAAAAEAARAAWRGAPSGLTLTAYLALAQRVCGDVTYVTRDDPGVFSPEETLAAGSGSCRDTAWLMTALVRSLGVAARFVSGYLIELDPDTGLASAELHAWTEAFFPGPGWLGVDLTSGLLITEGHIPLAAAPTPDRAAPVIGSHAPCQVTLSHEARAVRLS